MHALLMNQLIRGRSRGAGRKAALKDKKLKKAYEQVITNHRVILTDLPDKKLFMEAAANSNPKRWKKTNPLEMELLEEFIVSDITRIMVSHPADDKVCRAAARKGGGEALS
ncbi:MAG: hypothetical protein GY696_07555 [Gammaproteobacteria bacterium]|nr:hypothetical protein [Gammaproteobacteria bacterium]